MNSYELKNMLTELDPLRKVGAAPQFHNDLKLYKKDNIEFDDFLAAGLFVKDSTLSNEPLLSLLFKNMAEG